MKSVQIISLLLLTSSFVFAQVKNNFEDWKAKPRTIANINADYFELVEQNPVATIYSAIVYSKSL